MRSRAGKRTWPALVLAGAVLTLFGAGCGGSGGGATSNSATPIAEASASPVVNIVQAAPVRHVKVGDLTIGYRVVGPLALAPAEVSATPAGSPAPGTAAAGEVTPLLLIMGSSGTMDMWSPAFVAALAQDRQVIVFDNRGIGETDDPMGGYPFSQLADDTAGLIRALGYGRVDVLGWSMGGSVAVDLAVRHPAVVEQLVSYAGDAGGRQAIPATANVLAVLMDTSGSAEKRGERLIALLFPKAYRDANPAYAGSFPIPTEPLKPAAIDLQNKAIGEWKGVWAGLDGITCPTLFVTGAEDELTPPQNAVMMTARVPGSWLNRFAGAGHGLMYQDPQGLAEAVLTFLGVTESEAAAGG